jgi:hypothetical protein
MEHAVKSEHGETRLLDVADAPLDPLQAVRRLVYHRIRQRTRRDRSADRLISRDSERFEPEQLDDVMDAANTLGMTVRRDCDAVNQQGRNPGSCQPSHTFLPSAARFVFWFSYPGMARSTRSQYSGVWLDTVRWASSWTMT